MPGTSGTRPELRFPGRSRGNHPSWQMRFPPATLHRGGTSPLPAVPGSSEVHMSTHKRIDVSKVGDVTVVRFADRKIIAEAEIQELGVELFALVERDNRRSILLNFENVDFLSSAALGKLITLDRKMKSVQGRLKMSNVRPEVMEVFQVTKLNKVFDIRGEEAEAISAF
jgi:anti-sigma B factor antagonist